MKRQFLLPAWCFFCAIFFSCAAWAFDDFVIQDIHFQGLQRISLGTVFTYLPVKVGDSFDESLSTEAIRALYQTGFFEDVAMYRDGDALIVQVTERPSIASIEITGNEEIKTEQLDTALDSVGLVEGRIFNRTLLDQIEQELHRQYFSLSKYGVKITSTVKPLERNRVAVTLAIDEGEAATIRSINLIGNKTFPSYELLDDFQLSTPTAFSFFTSNDKYAKEKLQGDLEILRSYYLDRGYLNYSIDSTQVSITPNKRDVYITVNMTEGDVYRVKEVKLEGTFKVPREELQALLQISAGDIFSRRRVVDSSNAITERLAIDGYAFANVNTAPVVDEEKKEVSLTFFVDPGNQVYVRRINITGNTKTQDEVIRRELRQMEGSLLSTPRVQRSKTRLQRLTYFDEVNIETPPVPGTTDQVDLNVSVKEGSSGTFTAGFGYGETQGFLINTSVTFNNFLGTGKLLSTELNNSQLNTIYSLSYLNPYYTLDGVSRGFDVFYRETNAEEANLAAYTTDSYGANVKYTIPLNEFDSLRLGLGFENTHLELPDDPAQDYVDWVSLHGDRFDMFKSEMTWIHDTRDRVIFPASGVYQTLGIDIALPGGDLEFYKASYLQRLYVPLINDFIFAARGEVAYGDGYGDTDELPFFENYYAGGTRTVRGFEGNTLGPQDSQNDPFGGDTKVVGGIELIMPPPFADDSKNFRLSTFIDAGNVFGGRENFSFGDLRVSYGFGMVWITPVGALTFYWAWPLVSEPEDKTQVFQFTIGAPL